MAVPERIETACPPAEQWAFFQAGLLPEAARETFARHLDQCPQCLAALDTLADVPDSVLADLRRQPPPDMAPDSACERLADRAGSVAPMAPAEQAATEDVPWADPHELGDYRLLGKLPGGGMGTVYKAEHVLLHKIVAVKVLPPDRVRDPEAVARFLREIQAVGALNHPNLVVAHDARHVDGRHLLVMEYIQGADLARLVRQGGRLPVADACEVVRQAAVGLQHVHAACKVVHRDLKPSNLMLTAEGCVKVLDFGLARLAVEESADDELSVNRRMGTADYMSPEQWLDSHNVDVRADLYSLGCTLYHLLAGSAPFGDSQHNSLGKKMQAHLKEPPPPIEERRPDLPAGLVAVLDRLLAKKPEHRFAAPIELAEALQPFAAGHDLAALLKPGSRPKDTSPTPAEPSTVPLRRKPIRWTWAAAAGAVAALAVFISAVASDRPQSQEAAPAAPAVIRLEIKHYRAGKNPKDLETLGDIGGRADAPRLGDLVVIHLEFDRPLYPYLLAINPDGSCELLFPEKEPPKAVKELVHPLQATKYVTLDQAGLVSLVALGADRPLLAFADWQPPLAPRAWRELKEVGFWFYDGRRLEPLARTRVGVTEHGPKQVANFCEYLKGRPGVAGVRAVAFPVTPALK